MENIHCLTSQIFIGTNILSADLFPAESYLVSNQDIYTLYPELFRSLNFQHFILPVGENFKTRESKALIEDFLLSHNCKKNSTLIALGGGVISDLAGFVASTYMRGINFILIPTSLLAMVDSTIGGKNSVDTPYGKNLIGTIYRPSKIFIDLALLQTLPGTMWAAGMSEVIKIAAIQDLEFFDLLKSMSLAQLKSNPEFLKTVVVKAIRLKVSVVEKDEFEAQLRMILNFGHTVGHAVEAEVNELNHGLCVGIGMYCELEIANYLGCSGVDLEEFRSVLELYDVPYKVPKLNIFRVLQRMKLDKKRRECEVPIYVPHEIGRIKPSPILVSDKIFELFLSDSVTVSGSPTFESLTIPGSKSQTNRYLLLSALCNSTTSILGALQSEDTSIMINCLKKLGICSIDYIDSEFKVTGCKSAEEVRELYVGNAGTVARFLAMTCLLVEGETIMKGTSRMHQRPIKDLVDAINLVEPRAFYLEKEGFLPILVKGGGFLGGRIEVNCKLSSQYVSSILMAAPLGKSQTELILNCDGEPTSYTYIQMTIALMRSFGASVECLTPKHFIIKNSGYISPVRVYVEPDATSASYFFALSILHKKPLKLLNLGKNSLQGELELLDVLQRMGCLVTVTDTFVELCGYNLTGAKVSMNACTDSFITAAILMATCNGISEITGISNQKIKECDRIFAVLNELYKLGVKVEEIHDGIRIHGNPNFTGDAEICTYGDHRIAMAFSVLSTIRAGIKIRDPRVVNKTFPGYWKALKDCGFEVSSASGAAVARNILIVGMRGSGKSTGGREVALELGWEFIDIDEKIQQELEVSSLAEWISVEGIEKFRKLEFLCLQKHIRKEEAIIVAGGGIIEHPESLKLLKFHYPVVWLSTKLENIEKNLETESSHRLQINIKDAYLLRKPLFEQVADFKFYYTERVLEKFIENFKGFCNRVIGKKPPIPVNFSAFGCITENSNRDLISKCSKLTGIEIRADMFSSLNKAYRQLSLAKQLIKGVQTIFTYRSEVNEKYWKTLGESLSFIPDFIDVQFEFGIDWYENFIHLCSKLRSSRIILSYHTENTENLQIIYRRMQNLSPDIVKFIAPFVPTEKSQIPEIRFALGLENTITRLENIFFSPVKIDISLGKGQLSYEDLDNYQKLFHIKPALLKFFLAGNNISRSPASSLYNKLFKSFGLDYTYDSLETESIENVVATLKEKNCMGMSITIPFKVGIIIHLDTLSEESKEIGSVNTITKYKNVLIGHNTDWRGIYHPIKTCAKFNKNMKACVLGAGGTSRAALYALKQLGLKDYILWNRTTERLESSTWPCEVTIEWGRLKSCNLIINTLPGDADIDIDWIDSSSIVFECAYFPENTSAKKTAMSSNASYFNGKDMYVSMAQYQFELFTARNISLSEIKKSLTFTF